MGVCATYNDRGRDPHLSQALGNDRGWNGRWTIKTADNHGNDATGAKIGAHKGDISKAG